MKVINHINNTSVIVSLTSFPARIASVPAAVRSLLRQSVQPEKIVLWLAEEEFPGREAGLPGNLLELVSDQFNILWCENIFSYKKLIPALKQFPDAVVITADDDIIYPVDTIESLMRGYSERPNCIQTHRLTKMKYEQGSFNFEAVRVTGNAYSMPSYLHKLTGAGGVLYPPKCFHEDVLKKVRFMNLAPTNDDLWFWLMGALAGFKVNAVEGRVDTLNYIPGTQDGPCLWKNNNMGERRFIQQLNNIMKEYPQLYDLFFEEQMKMDKIDFGRAVCITPGELESYQSVIIYGAGSAGKRIKRIIERVCVDIKITAWAVSDKNKGLDEMDGIPVQSIFSLTERRNDAALLIASTIEANRTEMWDTANELGFTNIYPVYPR